MDGSHVATDFESRSAQNRRQYDFRNVHENKIIKSVPTPNQDHGFELPGLCGVVLASDLVHPSSHDK